MAPIPLPEDISKSDQSYTGGQQERLRSAFVNVSEVFSIPRVGVPPNRNLSVDALRGLAILLVVLGHAISNAENLTLATKYDPQFLLSNFLYTFHMPLFMLISGYVLFGKKIRISDRAIRLILPFFAWIPVYWFVNRYMHHYPWPVRFGTTLKDTILKPGIGLWFLPTLFLCSLLLIPVIRLEKVQKWMGELTLAVIFIGLNFIPYDGVGLMQVKYFFFFFAAGYLLAKHRSRIERISRGRTNSVLAIASVAFLGLFAAFYYYGLIKPYEFPISVVDLFKTPSAYLIRYLMAILGISAAVAFIRALGAGKARKVFAWFGLVTMDIYVAHGLMIQLAFGSGWLKVFTGFVLGIVLSLLLTLLLLRQWWPTAALFLGIKPRIRGTDASPEALEGETPLAEEPPAPSEATE